MDVIFEKVKKLDILPDMVKEVRSLKVHKKQNELEQELQIVRNLSQRDERDNNLEERLDLYVQDIHETLNYHQGFIKSG